MPPQVEALLLKVPRADDALCLALFGAALLIGVALGWYSRGLSRA